MTLEAKCMLSTTCKVAGNPAHCKELCYGYRYFHGASGDAGVWATAGIPKAYGRIRQADAPFKRENSGAYGMIKTYCMDILGFVNRGDGLYLYSVPNRENPKGTGTGKTTAAVILLNEFLVARMREHIKNIRRVDESPGVFVNVAKFQNQYNAQFRGPRSVQEEASRKYYEIKSTLLHVEFLILDDIGVRDATEAFKGEFYEVIDERASELRATVFTSNVPLSTIAEILDGRIASRIEGMTETVSFIGRDYRRRGDMD
jgi:DNA replication protein DnaC